MLNFKKWIISESKFMQLDKDQQDQIVKIAAEIGSGEAAGIKKLVEALTKAGQTKNDVMILLENTAGQKKY